MLTETNHLKKENTMHNIQIKTKVYTNAILEEIQERTGKTIHYVGIIADAVHDILADEKGLEAMVSAAWDDERKHRGVCPFTPEQLLEMAPHGFNPCPIEMFINGETDLRTAINLCFELTMSTAFDEEEWAENISEKLPELDFDLFHKEDGNGTEWLATDKDGKPLCNICPDCREQAKKEKKSTKKQVKN